MFDPKREYGNSIPFDGPPTKEVKAKARVLMVKNILESVPKRYRGRVAQYLHDDRVEWRYRP